MCHPDFLSPAAVLCQLRPTPSLKSKKRRWIISRLHRHRRICSGVRRYPYSSPPLRLWCGMERLSVIDFALPAPAIPACRRSWRLRAGTPDYLGTVDGARCCYVPVVIMSILAFRSVLSVVLTALVAWKGDKNVDFDGGFT